MVYTTHLWYVGGLFIIVIPTLPYITQVCHQSHHHQISPVITRHHPFRTVCSGPKDTTFNQREVLQS